MATLTDDVKTFIVQALACFDTPQQVADAVSQEFGLQVERMQVAAYDPTKRTTRGLGKKWRALFDKTRKSFEEERVTIPIANSNFRLRALNQMYDRARTRGNDVLASQFLEQAAKEDGGLFTNKQKLEHTGKDGGPIKTAAAPVDLSDLTDEELAVLERLAAKPGTDQG